jgi:hypothetical protein
MSMVFVIYDLLLMAILLALWIVFEKILSHRAFPVKLIELPILKYLSLAFLIVLIYCFWQYLRETGSLNYHSILDANGVWNYSNRGHLSKFLTNLLKEKSYIEYIIWLKSVNTLIEIIIVSILGALLSISFSCFGVIKGLLATTASLFRSIFLSGFISTTAIVIISLINNLGLFVPLLLLIFFLRFAFPRPGRIV